MVKTDRSDNVRVVSELSAASLSYQRQFIIWVGVGSGGGIAALLSLAGSMHELNIILRQLLPSLAAFGFIRV